MEQYPGELPDHQARNQYFVRGDFVAVDKKGKQLPLGIRQRANGRYEGRVKVEYRSYSVYADTITETKKKMRELKYKLDHGLFVEKEKITLDEWNKTWMEQYKKNRVKNSTYNSYQKYYKGAISKRLGKKNIVDIRGEHVQSLYNDLVKEEWALSSIKVVAAVLNGCFQQALKNGLIERNPVTGRASKAERAEGKTGHDERATGAVHGICQGELFIQFLCSYASYRYEIRRAERLEVYGY